VKSAKKARKILFKSQLLEELSKKDDKIIMLSHNLDAVNHAMIGLAKSMGMEEECSIADVLKEVKKRLGL